MTDNDINKITSKIESLHKKILKSKFAKQVTESEMMSLILAVGEIDRQKAEIERLKERYNKLCEHAEKVEYEVVEKNADISWFKEAKVSILSPAVREIQAEAIKEFAERLINIYESDKRYDRPNAHTLLVVLFYNIYNLVKEMIGEENVV